MLILIVCAGDIAQYQTLQKKIQGHIDFVICADGGAKHHERLGLKADLLLGDMDSIDATDLENIKQQGCFIKQYPTMKDATDSELAPQEAICRNPHEIWFVGGTGDRLDHTLTNIFLLFQIASHGIFGKILTDYQEIYLAEKNTQIHGNSGQSVSLIPISQEVSGISTTGLLYALQNETLYRACSRGVSNILCHEVADIRVDSGDLLIVVTDDVKLSFN